MTHPDIYEPPTSREDALRQVDFWLESPTSVLLAETGEYWTNLRDVVRRGKVDGPMIHDARVAALCLTHGVRELWSADRDFSRFSNLNVTNPLTAE